jgi:hypothetical protein
MKKTLLIAFALLFTGVSFAQIITPVQGAPATVQMETLCKKIKDYNNKRADAKLALVNGDFTTEKTDFAAAKMIRQEIKATAETLANEGVKHPLRSAHKEIKKADSKKIAIDVSAIRADKIAKKAAIKAGDANAAATEEAAIKTERKTLKTDIKEAKRDGSPHIFFIKNNHVS